MSLFYTKLSAFQRERCLCCTYPSDDNLRRTNDENEPTKRTGPNRVIPYTEDRKATRKNVKGRPKNRSLGRRFRPSLGRSSFAAYYDSFRFLGGYRRRRATFVMQYSDVKCAETDKCGGAGSGGECAQRHLRRSRGTDGFIGFGSSTRCCKEIAMYCFTGGCPFFPLTTRTLTA
jgi:hypothetical protein